MKNQLTESQPTFELCLEAFLKSHPLTHILMDSYLELLLALISKGKQDKPDEDLVVNEDDPSTTGNGSFCVVAW